MCGVETQKVGQSETAASSVVIDPQQEAIMASEFIKEDPKWGRYYFSYYLFFKTCVFGLIMFLCFQIC